MTATQTAATSNGEVRIEMLERYLDRLYGDLTGWIFVAVGHGPYQPPGKVKFRDWREKPWQWPTRPRRDRGLHRHGVGRARRLRDVERVGEPGAVHGQAEVATLELSLF